MENPTASASAHVEAAHGPRASEAADDQYVSVDDARSIETDLGRYLGVQPAAEVNGTIVSKVGYKTTGLWVEGEKIVPYGREEPPFTPSGIFPKYESALTLSTGTGATDHRVPRPEFESGLCVEGDDLSARCRGVKHAGNDQIVGLVFAPFSGVVGPCDLQLGDVVAVDLAQRRIERTLFVEKEG
jgi:hypothetical protein